MRRNRLSCVLLLLLAVSAPLYGGDLRILVQSSPLAGFRYHAAEKHWDALREGDPLDLRREPDNPHDANAVRVEWRGELLGYIPRAENGPLAWAMDRGDRVSARIAARAWHRNPRKRLRVEVFAE